jgi:hypothetical protein
LPPLPEPALLMKKVIALCCACNPAVEVTAARATVAARAILVVRVIEILLNSRPMLCCSGNGLGTA